ncbi:hypothetical protein HOY82DRAFT_617313 [Tuber indicum]|nr:hypothetical protein HOY82DRAFT_617313 [Tuber indicum]
MCIQTITSYACNHLSTSYNTTTPHCSTTSICTLPKPLPTRNEKSSLLCSKCLAEKIEREANQMRELEHFVRVSGGKVKVAVGKEKEVEGEAKNVKAFAKDLEELGYVTEGLLKRAEEAKGGSESSVVEAKEEEEVIAGTASEEGAEMAATDAEEVKIEEKPTEGIINPMGVYVEESSAPEQAQPKELDTLNFKNLSLKAPAQKPDAKSESKIGKPKSPVTNKSGKSFPGPSEKKSLEPKDTKVKYHTPERSNIAKSTGTLTPKKSVKFSTPTKANDAAAAAKGKARGSKPSV